MDTAISTSIGNFFYLQSENAIARLHKTVMSREKTDTQLVVLLTQDNEAAFSELYVRYKDKLRYFCLSLLKSNEEADDIVQEIFIRIWESRSFINPDLSFSSFLYTMARNRILNYFRNMDIEAKVKAVLAMQKPAEETAVDSEIIYTEYQNILQKAIALLPPQRQKIFNLSRIENMSHNEISTQLGISIYTVQEHISEALKFIKIHFNKHTDISLSLLLLLVI